MQEPKSSSRQIASERTLTMSLLVLRKGSGRKRFFWVPCWLRGMRETIERMGQISLEVMRCNMLLASNISHGVMRVSLHRMLFVQIKQVISSPKWI